MISEDKILLAKAYSIDLYAINLNEKFVPESHTLALSEIELRLPVLQKDREPLNKNHEGLSLTG